MTKIKTLRATDGWTGGRVDGITLRGTRGPKKNNKKQYPKPGEVLII